MFEVFCTVSDGVVVTMLAPWEAPARLPEPEKVARAEWPKSVAKYAAFVGKSFGTITRRIRLKLLDCERRDGEPTYITQEQHERYAAGLGGLHRERSRR